MLIAEGDDGDDVDGDGCADGVHSGGGVSCQRFRYANFNINKGANAVPQKATEENDKLLFRKISH